MKKENIPIIVAIALPVILVLGIAAFVYIPSLNDHPQYNFLYTETTSPYAYSYQNGQCTIYKNYYDVEEGKLMEEAFASSTRSSSSGNPNNDVPDGPRQISPQAVADSYCGTYISTITKDAPDLYLYNSGINTSKIISYGDAAKLIILEAPLSPDGYAIGPSYQDSGIFDLFVGGGADYGLYAIKANNKEKLSISQSVSDNAGSFSFIGWISK